MGNPAPRFRSDFPGDKVTGLARAPRTPMGSKHANNSVIIDRFFAALSAVQKVSISGARFHLGLFNVFF